jgi:hypothetical protein
MVSGNRSQSFWHERFHQGIGGQLIDEKAGSANNNTSTGKVRLKQADLSHGRGLLHLAGTVWLPVADVR